MNEEELDAIYTRLCNALTGAGEEATPAVLARLVLLLMKRVGDKAVIDEAIDIALRAP